MASGTPSLPVKRTLAELQKNEVKNSEERIIIELSDSDCESSAPPPKKRQKSLTPLEHRPRPRPHQTAWSRDRLPSVNSIRLSPTSITSTSSQPHSSGPQTAQVIDLTIGTKPGPPAKHALLNTIAKSPPFLADGINNSAKGLRPTKFDLTIPRRPTTPQSVPGQRLQPQPTVEVTIRSPKAVLKSEWEASRKNAWSQLQNSAELAQRNPKLVEEHFGQTGFSEAFNVKDEEKGVFMRGAASKKRKKQVERSSVNLEIESITRSVENLRLTKAKLIHPSRTARDILTSRFDEKVYPPLTFSNDINQKRLHGKFQLIDRYIFGDKVKPVQPSSNTGCRCTDCTLSGCSCFTKTVDDTLSKGQHDKQITTYVRRPDGMIVLSDEYIARELKPIGPYYEISECSDLCACGPKCLNRVVSKGRTLPLEIFQTLKCGFGVRSAQNIIKGQFIELYLGEVITGLELDRREQAENDEDPAYIYSLDWFAATSMMHAYHVDGKYFGSAMRFVNHSCNPNTRCFPVQMHKEDRKTYYLAFFAIRDIPQGTEICIDYAAGRTGGAADGVPQSAPDAAKAGGLEEQSDDLFKCQCGEKNCRGILWTPGVKARRRRRHED